jgi:hypothetical protein
MPYPLPDFPTDIVKQTHALVALSDSLLAGTDRLITRSVRLRDMRFKAVVSRATRDFDGVPSRDVASA